MALADVLTATLTDAALGAWLGTMAFFSFVGAPRTFAVLGEELAGEVVNDVFPRYYVLGIALGGVAAVASLAGAATGTTGALDVARAAALTATGVALLATVYARFVLVPRMDAAGPDAFQRYHGQSVALNAVAMVAVAAALVATHL